MNVLADYDMVLALSIEQINEQFRQLCNEGILEKSWKTQLSDDGSELDAKIKEFKLSALKDENKRVLFTISFESGKLRYWKGRGPASTKKELGMQGCEYAFAIKVAQLECKVEKISEEFFITKKANEVVSEIIKGSSIPEKYFTVQSLFLDFQNANVTEFDTTKSILEFKDDSDAIETFQSLITGYLRKFRGSKNPYILGYDLKLLPNLSPISEAIFTPTYCTFSISYHDTKKLQALNFLMMTENREKPSGQSAGILDKSLINNQECHGGLAIKYDLFKSKYVENIVKIVEKTMTEYMEKITSSKLKYTNEESGFLSGQKVKSNPTKSPGKLIIRNEDGYTWSTEPNWKIHILVTKEGYAMGSMSDSWFSEDNEISAFIKIDNSQQKEKLEIYIELKIKTKQIFNSSSGSAFGQASSSQSSQRVVEDDNFQKPSYIKINISPEAKGKLNFSYETHKGEFSKKDSSKYSNFNESLRVGFELLHDGLNDIANSLKTDLEEKLTKDFEAKVILPLGNVYCFKNIRLYEEATKRKAEDNAVVCDITYAPIYSPVEK